MLPSIVYGSGLVECQKSWTTTASTDLEGYRGGGERGPLCHHLATARHHPEKHHILKLPADHQVIHLQQHIRLMPYWLLTVMMQCCMISVGYRRSVTSGCCCCSGDAITVLYQQQISRDDLVHCTLQQSVMQPNWGRGCSISQEHELQILHCDRGMHMTSTVCTC